MLTRNILLLVLALGLSACGGGGSDTSNTNNGGNVPPPSSNAYQTFEQFNANNGALTANLSISTLESMLQLASMARESVTLFNSGQPLTCGEVTNLQPPLTSSSKFQVEIGQCYSQIIGDRLTGSYNIEITNIEQNGQLDFTLDLTNLQIISSTDDGYDNPISLAGTLRVKTLTSFEIDSLSVSLPSTTAEFKLTFSSPESTEIIKSLDIRKTTNYIDSRYSIEGSFTVDSELAATTYNAELGPAFSGFLNTPADSGQLLITGTPSDMIVEAVEQGYRIKVDLMADGTFETPDTPAIDWQEIVEGVLFYDPRSATGYSPSNSVFTAQNEFRLLEFNGYTDKADFGGDLYVQPNATLSYLFNRPLDLAKSEAPTLEISSGIPTPKTKPAYQINGALLTVTLDADELNSYRLGVNVTSNNDKTLAVVKSLWVLKPVLAIVNSAVFAEEGSDLELDGKSLSRTLQGEISNYHWQQLTGPSFSFDASSPVINLNMPDIDKEYEEASFLLTVSDIYGHSSTTEFRFLILDRKLNRHVLYVPFADNIEKRVHFAKSDQGFIVEGENSFQYDHDPSIVTQTRPIFASAYIGTKLPEGDFVADVEQLHTSLESYYVLGINRECEERAGLGPIAENFWDIAISKNLQRQDNKTISANIQASSYCSDHNQVRTEFGIYIKPGLYSVFSPGFVMPGQPTPIKITSGDDKAYDTSVTGDATLTAVTSKQFSINTTAISANSTAQVEISSDKYLESLTLDVLPKLSNKALIYFESSVRRSTEDRAPAFFNFHHLKDLDEVRIDNKFNGASNLDIKVQDEEHSAFVQLAFPESGPVLNKRLATTPIFGSSDIYMQAGYQSTACGGFGWYELLEYELDSDNKVKKLALDFSQTCNAANTFDRGAIRYNSSIPIDFSKLN